MSSHRKNFRRRADDAEDANGDAGSHPKPTTATKTQTLTVPKPKSPPRRQGASRLSFADDEDDDDAEEGPFAHRRRPTASVRPARTASPAAASLHRLTPARERLGSSPVAAIAAVSASKPSNFQSHAGEYTPERLRELQKNARPLPGSLMRAPSSTPLTEPRSQRLAAANASSTPTASTAAATEPVVILKGLVKPMAEASIGPRKSLHKEEEDKSEEEEGDEEDEGPVIPDRATIEAIRAKRQQLQQPRHAAPDYISLDGGGVLSSRDAGGESSDEDDNETRGRIAMYTDKSSDGPRSTKGVFGGINNRGPAASLGALSDGVKEVEDDRDDDDDEEERRWEEEQFRKGLGRRLDDASSAQRSANGASAAAQVQPQPFGYSVGSHYQPSLGAVVPAASVFTSGSVEFLSIAQQADVANKALQENIRKLRETHKTTVSALVKTDTHLSEALSEISSLDSGLKNAGDKFVYMQELQNYISVMCDFLNDKAFYIEELEEHMQKLHENRALAISDRRAADLADESSVIEASVNAAVSILSKGSSSAHLSAALNAAQAAAAAARESSNLPPELDEFGRDINLQKRMDLKRREENRSRRKTKSESKRMASAVKNDGIEKIEGELSTDESDSESTAYVSSRDELLKTADLVFSDASEEYSSLRIVKDKFEGWRTQYPSAYRDAHVALSVPSVFTPYVRLELLKWDPLHEATDFFDMDWHKVLFDYGAQDDESASSSNDTDVVPVLVEKVALPILHHRIKHCWDVLSTQRTENAVDAVRMVIGYLPTSSKDLHQLLACVKGRLTQAIADMSVPAWGSMVTRTVPGAAQYAAYRFGVATRLLKNVCLWKDILAGHVVEKLALDELLKGKILPHMKSIILDVHDAITRAERVAASLAGVWGEQSQKLQPFVDLVVELGNKLERRQMSGISEEETRGLARRLKIILATLNEYDKARAISKKFQLREAL
ncbi:transcriptional repressor ILP1-like [Panicum virgatum]|uniref:GCF C-terminal domain-containing protein n=2 Tax=Panicum virgatum TaxID=38727 RepID=A0A8T0MCG4_PANVG|nr:transcriptional repressor ILP1-like [Panicum virgatum]KAG2533771.1 hypothetical protein PVAP13_9NG013700 [Panicum virgatum]KAG2533773.1 hypothetical protein PVAP13_9NG013700 [Panicum virgatum]